jgi:hypothetical protein
MIFRSRGKTHGDSSVLGEDTRRLLRGYAIAAGSCSGILPGAEGGSRTDCRTHGVVATRDQSNPKGALIVEAQKGDWRERWSVRGAAIDEWVWWQAEPAAIVNGGQ